MIRLVAGRCPSGRAAAACAVEPIYVVSSEASIPNAEKVTAKDLRPALLFAFSGGRPTIRYIQQETAEFYGIDPSYMTQPDRAGAREARVSHPRQVAMMLAREFTNFSLPTIGKHFHRDHSTVLHAVKAVTRRAESDPLLAAEIEVLRERFGG